MQVQALRKDFDLNLVMKAFIVLFIVGLPFSYVHELSHGLVCSLEGKDYKISIGIFGSSLTCFSDVQNKIIFRAAGGLVAGLAAIIPYVIFRKTIDRYPYISIVLLSMACSQFANGIIEAFMNDDYIKGGVVSIYTIYMVQSISFIYFAHRFSKKKIKEKESYLQASFLNHLEQSKEINHEATIKSLSDYLQAVKASNYDSKLANEAIDLLDNEIRLLARQVEIKTLAGKLHELDREPSFAEKLHKVFQEINLARDIIFDDRPYNKSNTKGKSKSKKNEITSNDYGFNLNDESYKRVRKAWKL